MTENKPTWGYRPLPWPKNWIAACKQNFTEYWKNYRFPWKKLLILGVLALIVLTVYLAVVFNQITVPAREAYDKTGFVEATEYIDANGAETVLENGGYKFVMKNSNTTFSVTDKSTGETWKSNPDTFAARFLDTMVVYCAGSLGAASAMSAYEQAVKFDDYLFRVTDDSVEILYEIGGKKGVDRTDFPEIISDARMQEKILSKLEEGSTAYRRVADSCYMQGDLQGETVWKLKDGITGAILNQLYQIMYVQCGYTKEDLQYDLDAYNVVYEDTYAYVEIAVRYTLTEKGFEVRLINDSIYEKEKFPLVYVDLLPYFGCGSLTDTGYAMIPDGSGVLIDFNNERAFGVKYQQRVYGKELAVNRPVMENEAEQISLPLYGMRRNDQGFIAVAETGAEMALISANVSSVDNPYNQAYYRYVFRESEVFDFAAISSTTSIVKWTDWYCLSDFTVGIMFVHEDEGSYTGMAHLYRDHLISEGVLSDKDETNSPVFDLTLLGGYMSDENFIGIPYRRVRSLTSSKQVRLIADELLSSGITELNIIYKGWGNDGLKSTYMGNIDFEPGIASRRELRELQVYLAAKGIRFFPEAYLHTAFTGAGFNEKEDAIRDVFGEVVANHAYNEALLYADASTLEEYTLKAVTIDETLSRLSSAYNKLGFANIAFGDFGSKMYGSYEKKDTILRPETLGLLEAAGNELAFDGVLIRNPSLFVLKFADVLTDLPTYGTDYQIVAQSIPFYQLVLSGYLDYSSDSFNLDDQYTLQWHKMKAIETASNFNMTWSYQTTLVLTETEYSYYYSTFYQNWLDKAVAALGEMEAAGIYGTSLASHDFLKTDGSVTKSVYEDGTEIVFNYGISDFVYGLITVSPNSFEMVKEGNQ